MTTLLKLHSSDLPLFSEFLQLTHAWTALLIDRGVLIFPRKSAQDVVCKICPEPRFLNERSTEEKNIRGEISRWIRNHSLQTLTDMMNSRYFKFQVSSGSTWNWRHSNMSWLIWVKFHVHKIARAGTCRVRLCTCSTHPFNTNATHGNKFFFRHVPPQRHLSGAAQRLPPFKWPDST